MKEILLLLLPLPLPPPPPLFDLTTTNNSNLLITMLTIKILFRIINSLKKKLFSRLNAFLLKRRK